MASIGLNFIKFTLFGMHELGAAPVDQPLTDLLAHFLVDRVVARICDQGVKILRGTGAAGRQHWHLEIVVYSFNIRVLFASLDRKSTTEHQQVDMGNTTLEVEKHGKFQVHTMLNEFPDVNCSNIEHGYIVLDSCLCRAKGILSHRSDVAWLIPTILCCALSIDSTILIN